MSGKLPVHSLIQDNHYHISWITPELASMLGISVGEHVSACRNLPWAVARRYIEAAEECLATGRAIAWSEPGDGDRFPSGVNQVIPLPHKRGVVASFVMLPSGHGLPGRV